MEIDFSAIESKWRKQWEESGLYRVEEDRSRPKYYVLDMFPYPSGAGLHVGHPLGYVASDIVSRYKRLRGFNVLHPMGFDAFGLPAEQYAIETGTHPAITTEKNINTYTEQLKRIGFCYDWDREVQTSDPSYYKWTQWIFMQLFESWYNRASDKAEPISTLVAELEANGSESLVAIGQTEVHLTADAWKAMEEAAQRDFLMPFRLAYLDHADVWWCEALGTVLANDEVKDGVSERGGHPVEKIKMRQWFLRITEFAPRLLSALDTLAWSDSMKEMQRNWIGRSEGAKVYFDINHDIDQDIAPIAIGVDNGKGIEVFTTRPDTIFGATFMVLAPEHEWVARLTTDAQKEEVDKYIAYVKTRSERDRQAEVKTVTGCFTGTYATNPFTGKQIPIWIAEYVLAGYGTGAIMAVPSNDERDRAFAEKFGLEIIPVVDQSAFPDAGPEDKVGVMQHSGFLDGLPVTEAITKAIAAIVEKGIGARKVNYRLRDAGFSRQRYWGEPFPVKYVDGRPYLLDESELPLELPEVEEYKPGGKEKAPLAQLKDWVNLPDGSVRETDTMPGYAGSSWYFLRYMDPKNHDRFVGEEAESYWQDVDLYIGGTEHAVGHLLYSRMWQKFFFDRGWVKKDEPFQQLVNQGMIQGKSAIVYRKNGTNTYVSKGLKDQHETTQIRVSVDLVDGDELDTDALKEWRADFADANFILEEDKYICGSEVEKMSKRYHNVVNPDDMINQHGADCFRMYEMFLGPIDASKPWDTKGITGVSGFLRKLWRLYAKDETWQVTDNKASEKDLKTLHRCILKVQDDIERLSFNTAVSAFMIAVNDLTDSKCSSREVLEPLLVILAPFAPFITEELWHRMGNGTSVHTAEWPRGNPDLLVENSFNYPVSINGKMRTNAEFPLDMPKADMESAVLALEAVQKWTEGKAPKKIIIVQGRIINIVV